MPSVLKTPSTDKDIPFKLALTYTELSWLAGVFGHTRLALPVAVPPLEREALRQTQDSLVERSLICRNPGMGWKVDQLAAFLVQSLGTVDEYVRVEVLRRGKEPAWIGLYGMTGLTLLANCAAKQVEFVFLPDEIALVYELFRQLELGTWKRRLARYSLPEAAELVRAAWQDAAPTRRFLARSGLTEREVSNVLAWIDSLQTVIQFTTISLRKKESYCLVHDSRAVWGSEPSDEFAVVLLKSAGVRIRQLLNNGTESKND